MAVKASSGQADATGPQANSESGIHLGVAELSAGRGAV